jgi:YD repeat-containing protein
VSANLTRNTYDNRGRLASSTTALARTTNYSYDNLGRLVAETAPAAATGVARSVSSYGYDAAGNRTSETDPLGFVTSYTYDALDRRTTVTDARGLATVTSYDARGNTLSVTDASGNLTRYSYDRLDRLIGETDALGALSSFAYDLAGNRVRQTDRLGRVTSFVYDAANRQVEERWQQAASGSVAHSIKKIYDAANQLLGVIETDTANPAATTAWQFSYDALGNMTKSRMAPGEIVQAPAFDGAPNPPGSLNATDSTIDWDGDGKGERYDGYQITLAVGEQLLLTASSTAFDPVLMLQKPSGELATALFDDHSGGGTTARLLVTADVAGSWTIVVTSKEENAAGSYDLQIVKDQNVIVPTALVQYDFSYDKAGNLLSTTENQAAVADVPIFGKAVTGLGVRTSYTIDALNRVTRYEQSTLAGAVSKRANYTYRGDGSVSKISRFAGAGVNPIGTTTNSYDGMGRLTRISQAPSASAAISYGYSYDAASRMTSMTTPEGISNFTLDATDQLLSASLTGEAYAYDSSGNRTSGGTITGMGNRMLFDGTYRYAYDAEGNRTAKYIDRDNSQSLSVNDTDVTSYGYDLRNRLVAVSHGNLWTAAQAGALANFSSSGISLPGSDLELRYSYDFADRRIRRSIDADGLAGVGGASVSYAAYAGAIRTLEIAQIASYELNGRIEWVAGEVAQRNFYGNGVDEILAVELNGNTFWTLGDHQDSPAVRQLWQDRETHHWPGGFCAHHRGRWHQLWLCRPAPGGPHRPLRQPGPLV